MEISKTQESVKNEAALQNQVADIRNACFQEAEPANVDEYVSEMVRQHFCSRGYTVGDMAYVIPDDVYAAVRRGIPAYALYSGNRKELISSVKEADHLNMHGTSSLKNTAMSRKKRAGKLYTASVSRNYKLSLKRMRLKTRRRNTIVKMNYRYEALKKTDPFIP